MKNKDRFTNFDREFIIEETSKDFNETSLEVVRIMAELLQKNIYVFKNQVSLESYDKYKTYSNSK